MALDLRFWHVVLAGWVCFVVSLCFWGLGKRRVRCLLHVVRAGPVRSFGVGSRVSHELAAEIAHAVVAEVRASFGDSSLQQLQSSKVLERMSRAYETGHAATMTWKIYRSILNL